MVLKKLLLMCATLVVCLTIEHSQAQELSFNLPDLDENPVKLEKQDNRALAVVCFLGTECPLARLDAAQLNELPPNSRTFDPLACAATRKTPSMTFARSATSTMSDSQSLKTATMCDHSGSCVGWRFGFPACNPENVCAAKKSNPARA